MRDRYWLFIPLPRLVRCPKYGSKPKKTCSKFLSPLFFLNVQFDYFPWSKVIVLQLKEEKKFWSFYAAALIYICGFDRKREKKKKLNKESLSVIFNETWLKENTDRYTQTHIQSYAHNLTYTYTKSPFQITHTITCTPHMHTLSLSQTRNRTLSPPHNYTYTITPIHTYTHTLSVSVSVTHTLSLFHKHIITHYYPLLQ